MPRTSNFQVAAKVQRRRKVRPGETTVAVAARVLVDPQNNIIATATPQGLTDKNGNLFAAAGGPVTATTIRATALPTSASGLPSGSFYVNAGVVMIVP